MNQKTKLTIKYICAGKQPRLQDIYMFELRVKVKVHFCFKVIVSLYYL